MNLARFNKQNRIFRFAGTLVLSVFVSVVALAPAGEAQEVNNPARVWLTILSTTDLHGNILPIDYYTNKPDTRGLARVATLIRQARKDNPNSLLLDSGDTIQGTPLAYYHNRKNNTPPDPMMTMMNALGYDALAVGNHEYNFGLRNFEKARNEAKFPWLSGNTYRAGTNETYLKPYIVKEMSGVRVGVLGLTTPGIPYWENKENYPGLEFRETVAEAKKWVQVLREKERADVVVIAMHMGLEEDLVTGRNRPGEVANENAAIAIAEQVAGIDVILMGHTHREVPSMVIGNTLLAQANHWGRHLARVDLYLEPNTAPNVGNNANGASSTNASNTANASSTANAANTSNASPRWRIAMRSSRTIPVTDKTEADAEIVRLVEPYDRETQAWLSKEIGESAAAINASDARLRDNALLDLIQRVQLDAGKADVSMAASFNPEAQIPQGKITVRDIAGLYVYENTLVVLEVTGQVLKDALEHSAKYFRAYEAGKSPQELIDTRIPGYNFDIAEGVEYDLDLTKPFGSRVQNLRFRGKPLQMTQKLRLATNNYRVNGGGGYTMYKDAPVVYRSSTEIRDLIIDWVERNRNIPAQPTNNWRIVTSANRTDGSSIRQTNGVTQGTQSNSVASSISNAEITSRPQASCKMGDTGSGRVKLRAILRASGEVTDISVISSEMSEGLTKQAIEAARKIKFTPAMKDGRPVSQNVVLEYEFTCY